jgi:hypothetical protein
MGTALFRIQFNNNKGWRGAGSFNRDSGLKGIPLRRKTDCQGGTFMQCTDLQCFLKLYPIGDKMCLYISQSCIQAFLWEEGNLNTEANPL